MSRKPNRIIDIDGSQALLKILAHADKEIEDGETVPIEDVMAEFGVEAPRIQKANLNRTLPRNLH